MPLNQTKRQRGAKAKVASDASPPTRWPILSPASVKFWGGHEHRQHSLIREAFIEHLVHTGTLEELRTGSDHLDLEEQGLGRRASRHRPAAEGAGSSQAPHRPLSRLSTWPGPQSASNVDKEPWRALPSDPGSFPAQGVPPHSPPRPQSRPQGKPRPPFPSLRRSPFILSEAAPSSRC